MIDPFFLPPSPEFPKAYQPIAACELPHPDAVFITHSHPDHFDIGSLLFFGADTPIYVPEVDRESLLSIDMSYRLQEIGFRRVHRLRWFDETIVGGFRVIALPLYGEQPTTDVVLHPEVRNAGNTYLVVNGRRSYALIADSGRDRCGAVQGLAAIARKRFGPVDVLFGGYRAFAMYPAHFLFSSISRYLLFVPPESWGVRQKIMNDADDLIDTSEIWNARATIPYADGGAPWYSKIGLGPRRDEQGVSQLNPAVDPAPEHVLTVAQSRSSSANEGLIPTPAHLKLLRPGDSLSFNEGELKLHRFCPHAWPYSDAMGAR
jgi:hypothetical protein